MYKTKQEEFWVGQFGEEYLLRNNSEELQNRKIVQWARFLKSASQVKSIREFGCNIGLNLKAINVLKPEITLDAIEINKNAARQAQALNVGTIVEGSILEMAGEGKVDLVFTSGVLIHIAPEFLKDVYKHLYEASSRYILIIEYYNPAPVEVTYRGHSEKLFKRDFAGELMDMYQLKLVDYGFVYHRDNVAPADDLTYFLLEK